MFTFIYSSQLAVKLNTQTLEEAVPPIFSVIFNDQKTYVYRWKC